MQVETEISLEDHNAIVMIKTPFILFGQREMDLLHELEQKIRRILIMPKSYELTISLMVHYFADEVGPSQKALNMLAKEYPEYATLTLPHMR